jgi:hypothetical protein
MPVTLGATSKAPRRRPAAWKDPGFNDGTWLQGPSGFGYGDDDDATELTDMRPRRQFARLPHRLRAPTFTVTSPTDFDSHHSERRLRRRVRGLPQRHRSRPGQRRRRPRPPSTPPATRRPGSRHARGIRPLLPANALLLRPATTLLAIQVHNVGLTSSDASAHPELAHGPQNPAASHPRKRIRDIEALQHLIHVRGALARRQLQAVLGEFWETISPPTSTRSRNTSATCGTPTPADGDVGGSGCLAEAAQVEYLEYQFFHDNALGNFGDLLLFSATSPSQLIYLDNVLNVKGAANENYAREILELFGFGVDNRYTQV